MTVRAFTPRLRARQHTRSHNDDRIASLVRAFLSLKVRPFDHRHQVIEGHRRDNLQGGSVKTEAGSNFMKSAGIPLDAYFNGRTVKGASRSGR